MVETDFVDEGGEGLAGTPAEIAGEGVLGEVDEGGRLIERYLPFKVFHDEFEDGVEPVGILGVLSPEVVT